MNLLDGIPKLRGHHFGNARTSRISFFTLNIFVGDAGKFYGINFRIELFEGRIKLDDRHFEIFEFSACVRNGEKLDDMSETSANAY
jgi:hypothetical protein